MGVLGSYLKTGLLLALLAGILVGLGFVAGGVEGALFALFLSIVINLYSFWKSDEIVLSMYRARPLPEREYAWVYRIVERLAREAGIPRPRVFIVDDESPNAFATGRSPSRGVVVVTRGLLRLLDRSELEGVLAHEIAHIRNNDILVSTIAAVMAGAISFIADFLLWFGGGDEENRNILLILPVVILAPVAALLIQLAVSRSREFLADETGAMLCHKPLALASALKKIAWESSYRPLRVANRATASLFIVNPLSTRDLFSRLFSTHPPIEERIARLERM